MYFCSIAPFTISSPLSVLIINVDQPSSDPMEPIEMSEVIPFESFGRSLDAKDPFWYVQYDFTYREKRKHPFLISKEYKNESIGFGLRVNEKLINDCITSDSNDPYWKQDYFYIREDLRNPANAKIRRRIFRYFGI